MAFGTWFKNLITKGKQFIKKASPYIRKGVDIARRIAPMIGGPVGGVINGIANGVDNVMNLIDKPRGTTKPRFSDIKALPFNDLPKQNPFSDVSDLKNSIEMISHPILGGNKGRMNPILKEGF